jgi:hypothetical protein
MVLILRGGAAEQAGPKAAIGLSFFAPRWKDLATYRHSFSAERTRSRSTL